MKPANNSSCEQLTEPYGLSPIAVTYCLGVFNDNYFKQAAMLIAVTMGLSYLQGTATLLFALPFVLFSSIAGWAADRFTKRKVIIFSKGLEVIAMFIGAAGLLFGNWYCILAMVFLMGLQSTFFSPAMNGSIPEMFDCSGVPRVNGIIKLLTTLSVLAGVAWAGLSLDFDVPIDGALFGSGVYVVAAMIIFTAIAGFITSFKTRSKPAAGTAAPFPLLGPVSSFLDTIKITRDYQLLLAITADVCFYFIASMIMLTLNTLGVEELGFTKTTTSLLSVSLMIGLSIGSLLVSRYIDLAQWSRHLSASSIGIGVSLTLAHAAVIIPDNFQVAWLITTLGCAGISGGFLLIPITSFLQTHPGPNEKGRVLATSNFCAFSAILLSGLVFTVLDRHLKPSQIIIFIGIIAFTTAALLLLMRTCSQPTLRGIIATVVRWGLALRYRIRVEGLDKINKRADCGTMFLPNHPALIDPVIVMTTLCAKFEPRPLADADQIKKPLVRHLSKIIKPIEIPDLTTYGNQGKQRVAEGLREVVKCLRHNEEVVVYPSGRLYRSQRENLGANSGVHSILQQASKTRVILVRTTGLWGSSFSWAQNSNPSLVGNLGKMLAYLCGNFLFFGPRRDVLIEFFEDSTLKTITNKSEMNRYLEQFYNKNSLPNTYYPYYWWQGKKPRRRDEPAIATRHGSLESIPPSTVTMVRKRVAKLVDHPVSIDQRLASELGIDSLTMLELVEWIESEFSVSIGDLQAIETVKDLIVAAGGQTFQADSTDTHLSPPAKWFCSSDADLKLETGGTIASLFLTQALANKNKVVLSDQISGCKSYREILAAVLLLLPVIKNLNEERIGIMLPSSVSAAIVYLATLFGGKVPVMFNWTVGTSSVLHGLQQTGVKHIITAKALCSRVEEAGIDLSHLPVDWIFLENLKSEMRLSDKIRALVRAQFFGSRLKRAKIQETAVILFTSGSESHPKAVPLSHSNILANLGDFSSLTSFKECDTLLGMLPPFHSLGLAGTIILPLCIGFRTVYHPNPTEASKLAGLIAAYKVTTLIGTPTFLRAIIHAATVEQLKTLAVVFTGAEKCPDKVYRELKKINPKTDLCEGYGITECSPLVCLNTADNNYPGTIGTMMPSLEYAVINEETDKRVTRGERGLLLLRGPSIFEGYLNDTNRTGFKAFEKQQWYDTGDFVVETKASIFEFQGRKKRFIKMGGEMISLVAIEDILAKHYYSDNDSQPKLAVVSTGDDTRIEIVLFTIFATTRREVNTILKLKGFSPLHNIHQIHRIDEIPILGTGKTDYKLLKNKCVDEGQRLRPCSNQ